ncbi:hypothetical protein BDF14DRAFT_1746719 [Spinellus fusiger]|nr:hypothetical protein BDF14DRAFT_1746719 [Spinellus fusiger]
MKLVFSLLFSTLLLKAALAQTDAGCAASVIFNQCLQNQDIYIKTCSGQDYACLCKWHTTKLSCWDNCANDVTRGSQEGLKITFCSIATPINATSTSLISLQSASTTATSLAPPSPLGLSPSASAAAGGGPLGSLHPQNSSNHSASSPSSAASLINGQVYGWALAGVATYWFL